MPKGFTNVPKSIVKKAAMPVKAPKVSTAMKAKKPVMKPVKKGKY